jgi:hypothetical protein
MKRGESKAWSSKIEKEKVRELLQRIRVGTDKSIASEGI